MTITKDKRNAVETCVLSFFETCVLSEFEQIKVLLERLLLNTQIAQIAQAAETQTIDERTAVTLTTLLDQQRITLAAQQSTNMMSTLAAGFIRANGDRLTELLIDEARWTIDKVKGRCLGRVQREGTTDYRYAPNYSLAVRLRPFKAYAKSIGFDSRELKLQLITNQIKERQLTLFRDAGLGTHVYVIPLVEGAYTQRGNGNAVYGSDVRGQR